MFRGGWLLLGMLGGLSFGAAAASAPPVPWPAGERLTFALSWQGIGVGKFNLTAEPTEGGWRFRARLETTGLARVTGMGLEWDSQVGPDFFTDRFQQNLTEPFGGTTRLVFERQSNGSLVRVLHPNGEKFSFSSSTKKVLDHLSLIYFLRLHPEARLVTAVDHPQLIQGKLEPLRASTGLVGFRFARGDLLLEAWYYQDAHRTPVRIIFGRDFGRLEATLVMNSSR
jgi:hypothetical protein